MSGVVSLGAPIGSAGASAGASTSAGEPQTGSNPLSSQPGRSTRSDAEKAGEISTKTAMQEPPSGSGDGSANPSQKEVDAALLIQRNYRGHAARKRVKRMHLDKDARWDELVKAQHEKSYADGQLDNKNDVRSRWQRGMQAAARLQDGEGLHASTSLPDGQTKAAFSDDTENLSPEVKKRRRATFWGSLTLGVGKEEEEHKELPFTSKALEQQHWLEMIDGKHRYGSNLKYYFRKWKESDTEDNFFRWLDRGEGKDLDLEELPRERLEKERIRYLSAEQRLNYLVKVDKDGLLRWARNDELVDTAEGKWRDSGDGGGIIPDETWKELHPEEARREAELYRAGDSSGSRSSSDDDVSISSMSSGWSAQSGLQENEATHYDEYNPQNRKGWLGRKVEGVTPAGVKKQLLRKTLRRNTWIYVSDMKLNMFIGIKQTGTFQHSSFLAGGKVTSAGIIVVKQGLVKSLNPWSGHYRSSIDAYRSFIGQLENKGVDLSHVKVGKSVMTMWGLTKAAKIRKGRGDFVARFRKALHLPHESTEQEKSEELQRNAEKEEAEHQRRMGELQEAEEAEETDEDRLRVRREILYGRKRPIQDADGTQHSLGHEP